MANGSGGELEASNFQSIPQEVNTVQGQAIAQMVGGFAVGQLTVYLSQVLTETATKKAIAPVKLGENPYQGLKAFHETDGDRFFGRGTQTHDLWQRFQHLHDDRTTVRVLPIYGPSGSGKSSLARAGLIPTLGLHLLPGRDRARVVVLTPGNHPLEALATVLARIATQDPTPVAKMGEFQKVLLQPEGLRRIAGVFPDINFSPLIVLVDQFEEIYTLCSDVKERDAFIENLLCAASDSSQHVSVILTMRSDFLGATQQHPRLNKLFSSQGFLVPIMQPEELEKAITEPAKRAGYELDRATVQLLLEESQGQDGALPLLQFALTKIWEGLRQGVQPADTLEQIGGVGGALASEAKRLYDTLTSEQQRIARSIFLAVIQLHDDNKVTRRRAPISELIASKEDAPLVREVIDRFSRPGVWILVTSSNEQQVEMVEVAHEALIHKWTDLQEWLKEHWQALRQKRKIEQAAEEWQEKKKSKDYLLQGRSLRDAREFMRDQKDNSETSLSSLAAKLISASQKKQRQKILKFACLAAIFPTIGTLITLYFFLLNLAQTAIHKKDVECQQNLAIPILVKYLILIGQRENLEGADFCNDTLNGINLSKSSLWRANFHNAHLAKTNLQDADLREANFEGANLMKTDFSGADLEKAKFKGSFLYKTKFTLAKRIRQFQLEQAKLCETELPKQFTLNPDRDCEKLDL